MLFVETALEFESSVRVRRTDHGDWVDGKSIMQMMMLAGTQGTDIEVCANGDDAEQAIARVVQLIASKFGED